MSERAPTIGFVGIGNMGWPMAARLVGAGFPVRVADRDPERATRFATEIGGEAAADLPALARGVDIIITIVPTSADVARVIEAVRAELLSGTVLIDMTSGQPAVTRRLAGELAQAGVAMIDAPVSGGVARAKTGELAIMIGGSDATVERMRPILSAMGTNLQRTGEIGSGQAMKALNNLVSAGGFLIGIEAMLIGARFGLDPDTMIDVLNASTGMNNSTQKKFRQMVLSRRFDSGFSLANMIKDLSIALDVAHEARVPSPFAALCRELWAASAQIAGEAADHTEVTRLAERLAGIELHGKGS